MKIRICLLLTLIVSIFVGINSVLAEDLTCIYGKGNDKYKLVKSNDKNLLYESHSKEVNWQLFGYRYEISFYNDNSSDKNTMKSCFAYLATHNDGAVTNATYYFNFFNDQSLFNDIMNYQVYPLIDKPNNDKPNNDKPELLPESNVFYYQYNDLYIEEANKKTNNWTAKCSYYFSDSEYKDAIHLYFSENKYILINENSRCGTNYLDFTIDELNESFRELYICPVFLYMNDLSNDTTGGLNCNFSLFKKGYTNDAGNIESNVYISTPEPKPEPEPIKNCKGLFGDKLIEQINKIMDIIKIAVPILLIVFGIIDFTKAIFAGNEDNMKKAQKTFFKRIIAAVLVFIAPIFINLILNLANEVWGYISPETCIK